VPSSEDPVFVQKASQDGERQDGDNAGVNTAPERLRAAQTTMAETAVAPTMEMVGVRSIMPIASCSPNARQRD
jgi:hypothetical protein